MERFQAILRNFDQLDVRPADDGFDLQSSSAARRLAKSYIDLCNEELFYYQMEYVPDQIMDEWIDGMLSYLPLYDRDGHLVYADYKLMGVLRQDDLDDYPRIKDALIVRQRDNLEPSEQLDRYIEQIKNNLKAQKRKSSHRKRV